MMGPDEALTALYARPVSSRREFLGTLTLSLLRRMADLCGVDSAYLTKREAISEILANF